MATECLRRTRAAAATYEPRFFVRSPLFWPIARPAEKLADCTEWPDLERLQRVFDGEPPVRFVPARPRPRRKRRGPLKPEELYDARITLERCVPTRLRSWHDLLNALVWASFPRSKRALHERQLRALASRIPPGATRLPATRSREHDALALIDEGGVVVIEAPDRSLSIVFGHALHEGLVLGVRSMVARAVVVGAAHLPDSQAERLALADRLLEQRLRAPELSPDALPRIALAAVMHR
jgi:Protein of unknown function (DUF3025)